jgi:hypothetical protein
MRKKGRSPYGCILKFQLKVVGNEKREGSGGWVLFEDGFGPKRIYIYRA